MILFASNFIFLIFDCNEIIYFISNDLGKSFAHEQNKTTNTIIKYVILITKSVRFFLTFTSLSTTPKKILLTEELFVSIHEVANSITFNMLLFFAVDNIFTVIGLLGSYVNTQGA